MSLSEEITMLRKRVKEQDKEIRRLKEENEFTLSLIHILKDVMDGKYQEHLY